VSVEPDPAPSSEERVRLFVALELPDPVREQLVAWQSRALHGVEGIRRTPADHLHVTLCFLGSRYESEVDQIRAACEVLAAYPAPELRGAEALWLPVRRPRVLAVEFTDAARALARVHAALSEVLSAGGWYEPEARPYLPHVTVARLARNTRVPRRMLPEPPELLFRGSRVTLYRSRLSRSGARYEPLGAVELAG
jgi:RNA 2',3'-cyclic 3'-phosphodiesterase